MSAPALDETDQAILYALQEDARHTTNAAISERVGVSASTVGKRIRKLEEQGVIQDYRPQIDYERAGFPLQVLFICTAPIAEREPLIEETLAIDGVVSIRELMTGHGNVHVFVTGESNEDITRVAETIVRLGHDVEDKILLKKEYTQPLSRFRQPDAPE